MARAKLLIVTKQTSSKTLRLRGRLRGQVALITGASRGLGRNAALHLAAQGIDIIGTYHSKADQIKNTIREIEESGGRAAMLRLDISDTSTFPTFASEVTQTLKAVFGGAYFDYLINNAGFGIHAGIAETTEEDFDRLMKVHLKGPFFLTQRLLPLIKDGGRIINISTGLTRFTLPGSAAYASMKGGVEVWTRYLAKELGSRGICVNTVAPGAVETDFGGGVVRDNPEINKRIAASIALGRTGLPDDIGSAIAALLSDGGWINGQRIEVSGGQNL